MTKTTQSYEEQISLIAKGAGVNFFGTIFGKALLLLFTLLIARILGPKQVGLYFLGFSIINLAIVPALLGLDSGIVRYVALFKGENNENKAKGVVVAALLISLPLSVLAAVGLFLFAGSISVNVFHKPALASALRVFSFSLPFLAMSTLFLAATQALKLMRYKVYAKDFADTLFKIILTLIFFLVGFKLFGLVLATAIASVLVAGLSLYYVNKFIPLFVRSVAPSLEIKRLLGFSIPQTFARTLVLGMFYTDTLLLGYFVSAREIGIYNIAGRVALLGTWILESFNMIFSPIISDLYNRQETDLLSSLFKTVTKWVFGLTFPLSLVIIFLAKPILGMFGPQFITGTGVLIILSLGQMINAATGPVGFMIVMSGRPWLQLVTNMFAIGLTILLNYLLIPMYGMLGAAIATAASVSIVNLIRLVIVRVTMKMHPYQLSYLKPLGAGAAASLVVFLGFRPVLAGPPMFSLVVLATAFLITYGALLLLFGVEPEDQVVAEALKRKLAFAAPIFNRLS